MCRARGIDFFRIFNSKLLKPKKEEMCFARAALRACSTESCNASQSEEKFWEKGSTFLGNLTKNWMSNIFLILSNHQQNGLTTLRYHSLKR